MAQRQTSDQRIPGTSFRVYAESNASGNPKPTLPAETGTTYQAHPMYVVPRSRGFERARKPETDRSGCSMESRILIHKAMLMPDARSRVGRMCRISWIELSGHADSRAGRPYPYCQSTDAR